MPLPSCICVAGKPPMERLDDIFCVLRSEDEPTIPTVDFDFAATFSDGDHDDLMTAALWNAGVVGADWGKNWLEFKNGSPGANTFTYLRDHGVSLPFNISADGEFVSRDAVRGWRYDLAGNPPTYDQWQLNLALGPVPGVTDLTVVYFFNMNTVLNGATYHNDSLQFQGTDFFVPQLRNIFDGTPVGKHQMVAHAGSGTAGLITVSGGVWHCIVARRRGSAMIGEFKVYECLEQNGALIINWFLGEASIAMAAGDDIVAISFASYLPPPGNAPSGTIDMIGPFVDRSSAAFPPVNFPTPAEIPAPDPNTLGVPILQRVEGTSFAGNSQGDPITTWADISGNGNNFTGSGSTRPTVELNAFGTIPGANFDALDDFLSSLLSIPRPFTIMIVEDARANPSARTVTSPAGNKLISTGRTGLSFFLGGAISTANFSNQKNVGVLIVPAVGNCSAFINGEDFTTGSVAVADWGLVSLGADNPFVEPADSIVGTVFVFAGALTTQQRKTVEVWVRDTYGIVIYH